MKLYLYLTKREWSKTWIEGGTIPLNLASKYLSDNRSGINTPDENNQRELKNLDEKLLGLIGNMDDVPTKGKNSFKIDIGKISLDDKVVAKNVQYKRFFEDGYILSFSTKLEKSIMQKLGKEACVEILDFVKLFEHLNSQIEINGVHKKCEYTKGENRNVFLKSIKDEWQHEYRFYWKTNNNKISNETIKLHILPNTAHLIKDSELKSDKT